MERNLLIMESPICHETCLSNFNIIFQKGAYVVNEVSILKNDNFTVTPEMHVHVSCGELHKDT